MSPLCLSSPETTSGSMRPAAPCVTPTLLEFILPTADLAGDLWPNLVWTVATLGRAVDAINQGRSSPLRIQAASQPKTTDKKTARSKPVVTAEEDDEEGLGGSTPNKVWSKTKRETHKQRPNKADLAAKRSDRQKFMPEESDENLSDEDEPLPPRVHPRTRAGARQRQEHEQEKRNAEVYEGKTWMTMRGKQNRHYLNQQKHTQTLNDDYAVPSSEVDYWRNYTRKHSRHQNQWEETYDDDGDRWGSDVCGLENEWTLYHHRNGFGKSKNQSKWPIKIMLIFLLVMILTVVGCWYYPYWSRNAT